MTSPLIPPLSRPPGACPSPSVDLDRGAQHTDAARRPPACGDGRGYWYAKWFRSELDDDSTAVRAVVQFDRRECRPDRKVEDDRANHRVPGVDRCDEGV